MGSEKVAALVPKGEQEKDPFEQAAENEQADQLGQADQNEELDLALPEELAVAHDKPERIEAPQPVKKPAKAKTGRGLAFTAIGMSAVAIAMSGVSILTQKGMHATITEELTQIESYGINTRITQESITKQLEANTTAIERNAQAVQSFDGIRSDIVRYSADLEVLQGELQSMRGSIFDGQAFVEKHRADLASLTGRVSQLESRPARTVTKVVTKPKSAPAPNRVDTSKLDGASLASIDAWGAQTNVMLRSDDGEWIPLSQGDFYRGWQLVSAKGNTATFKNGKQTRKLQIEG